MTDGWTRAELIIMCPHLLRVTFAAEAYVMACVCGLVDDAQGEL